MSDFSFKFQVSNCQLTISKRPNSAEKNRKISQLGQLAACSNQEYSPGMKRVFVGGEVFVG
jgi:hypothetical protein